jgi:hypothetical protein
MINRKWEASQPRADLFRVEAMAKKLMATVKDGFAFYGLVTLLSQLIKKGDTND